MARLDKSLMMCKKDVKNGMYKAYNAAVNPRTRNFSQDKKDWECRLQIMRSLTALGKGMHV